MNYNNMQKLSLCLKFMVLYLLGGLTEIKHLETSAMLEYAAALFAAD